MAGYLHHSFNIHRITLKDHFRVGQYAIYIMVAYIIFLIFSLISRFPLYPVFLGSFFIVAFIFILPGMILHLNYTNCNRGYELHEYSDKIIIYKDGIILRRVDKMNIVSIQVKMAPNAIRNAGTRLTCEDYNYLTLYTNEGAIKVSNLLYKDIKQLAQKFEGVNPSYHRTIFAWIK